MQTLVLFLGVYLTEYTAFDNTKMIATDNYLRNAAQAQVDNGKLDYGFQVNGKQMVVYH